MLDVIVDEMWSIIINLKNLAFPFIFEHLWHIYLKLKILSKSFQLALKWGRTVIWDEALDYRIIYLLHTS